MASPLTTELFRFVTHRNPQSPDSRVQTHRFVRFDGNVLTSEFINDLAVQRNEEEVALDTKLRNMRSTAQTYWDSSDSFKTLKQLNDRIPNIEKIALWLRTHHQTITSELLISALLPLWTVRESGEESLSALKVRLWDSLVAINLLGIHVAVSEYLNVALLMFQAAENGDSETTDTVAKMMASARVLLPSEVFPLPRKAISPTAPPEKETPPNPDPQKEKRTTYENTLAEIRRLYERRIAVNKSINKQTLTETLTDNSWEKLSETDTATLSSESQDVLTELATAYPAHIETLIDILLIEIRNMMPKVARAVNKVVFAGGTFWEENKAPALKTGVTEGENHEMPPIPNFLRMEPLGIADLRIVEQELCCYKAGKSLISNPLSRARKKKEVPVI